MRRRRLSAALLTLAALASPLRAQEPAATPPAEETLITRPALRVELLAMRDEDQAARQEWIQKQNDPQLSDKVKAIDEKNTKRVIEIIDQNGWPGSAMVGEDGSAAAWILIQHATPEVIDKYLPAMQQAAEKGELSRSLVALTVDRQLVNQGKPQIYGSQFKVENGQWVPSPIADPDHVDERRKSVGLGPLEEYARQLREAYGTPPPPKATPEEKAKPEAETPKPPHL